MTPVTASRLLVRGHPEAVTVRDWTCDDQYAITESGGKHVRLLTRVEAETPEAALQPVLDDQGFGWVQMTGHPAGVSTFEGGKGLEDWLWEQPSTMGPEWE